MNLIKDNLKAIDPLFYELVKKEEKRQKTGLNLNAAISICPKSVLQVQNSAFVNIDAEGFTPKYLMTQTEEELEDINKQIKLYKKLRDSRANKNCEVANIAEAVAQKRLAEVFSNTNTEGKEIFVNLHPPTGAIANLIILNALLERNDTIMSLKLGDGGHLSHGAKINFSGKNFNVVFYGVDYENKCLDYDNIASLLKEHQPKILIAGFSSFPMTIDWLKIKKLIQENSPTTLLLADIAHTAGLVAGDAFPNPLGIADIVSMVTYKTFCGPRAAAILTTNESLHNKIRRMTFPGILGSPLLVGALGIGVSAQIARTEVYKKLQKQIVENARRLSKYLVEEGIDVLYGTTDSHIIIINAASIIKEANAGEILADVLEDCKIITNKQMLPTDEKNSECKGVRLGTTWITQLNVSDEELKFIAKSIKHIMSNINNKKELNVIKNQVNDLIKKLNK